MIMTPILHLLFTFTSAANAFPLSRHRVPANQTLMKLLFLKSTKKLQVNDNKLTILIRTVSRVDIYFKYFLNSCSLNFASSALFK